MNNNQKRLETAISNILRFGVLISVSLSTIGIILYYLSNGSEQVSLDSTWNVNTKNFFTFIYQVPFSSSSFDFILMSFGIVILMLTPYIRVITSIVYFAFVKDLKYLAITSIVFIIITLSLLRV